MKNSKIGFCNGKKFYSQSKTLAYLCQKISVEKKEKEPEKVAKRTKRK